MANMETDIPGYDIVSVLGKGGMATVYKARQKSFNREVALKVYTSVADSDNDEGFGQRFMQESQIIAKLHHSHIVQVYDVGLHESHYYISMEYLNDGNLAKKLAVGITLKDSVTLIRQAASALDFAHRKRIVHRDIKPENMMFREDGALVLTDFGIAKEMESQSNLTQTGLVIGTPKYMSPEQIRGDEIDHRTDIYALGIVFFRCLTNYLPFDGKDIVVTSYLQHNEPVPRLPREVACFQPIINKMLEKEPEDRYQKAGDIAAALERISPSAYRHGLTNLDVATASRHAPPTVTRSTSGRFNTESVNPPISRSQGSHISQAHDPRRKVTDYEDTLELTEARAAPSQYNMQWQDPLRQKEKQSSWGAWLMSFAILGAAGVLSNHLWGDQIRGYLDSTLAKWTDPTHEEPTTVSNADVVSSKSMKSLAPGGLAAYQEVEQAPEPQSDISPYPNVASEPAVATIEDQVEDSVEVLETTESTEDLHQTPGQMTDQNSVVGQDEEFAMETEEELEPEIDEDAYNAQIVELLLKDAEEDVKKWRLTKPKGKNAFDKYKEVLELQPDNEEAKAGIENIAQAYLNLTDRAINDQDFDKGKRYLQNAAEISDDSRLIRRYRGKLSLAEEAYQEAKLLDEAMRQAELIDRLLQDAAADEEAGRIRSPAGNNALEKYQRILALDPENTVAIEKLVDFGR